MQSALRLKISLGACLYGLALGLILPQMAFSAEDPTKYIDQLKAVGAEGAGNTEASVAWKNLVGVGIEALMPTLAAMDDAKPVAANWLRLAAQAVAEKEREAKRALPTNMLEAFVKDTKHAPASRRLAYEFLVSADAMTPARLLPGMIEDPSVEIRRDAIEAALGRVMPLVPSEPESASAQLQQLFRSSRDKDQTEKIAKALKELKVPTDLNKHFGVISEWMLIGPFDSTKGAGYDKAYDPEMKVDLNAKFKSKDGKEIGWVPHTTTADYGAVDLNATLGKHKDAVAYAFTTIEAGKEMPIEIRFGSQTAAKVFLNGKEVFAREEYHHGFRFDQYLAVGTLKAGRNELLLKACQNNQTENWAQDWKIQVRVCDFTGGALPLRIVKNK